MTAEIYLDRVRQLLPEVRNVVIQHRRYIIIPVAGVIGYYVLSEPLKDASNRWFAWIYNRFFLQRANSALLEFRERMKEDLGSLKTRTPHSYEYGGLQILEIGTGPGVNLNFFPEGSRVIAVEPNPYFVDELLKRQMSQPKLVQVIRGFAEDLRDVSSESVDVVVSTLVLCSVTDLDKSIKEIKRVLVKGGRFYFFEHQACHTSWKRYILQFVASPLWRIGMDGCRLFRKIHRQIEANGFDVTHTTQDVGNMFYIVRSNTHGYAIKK